MSFIAGIDFSLNGPSICIHPETSEFKFQDCRFIYITNTKKYANGFSNDQFVGYHFDGTKLDPIKRFDDLTDYFIFATQLYGITKVAIEGFSMGSKGRITDIAECTGILKFKLYSFGILCIPYAPTEIKKFATKKGNAKKNQIYEAWLKETNCDLVSILNYGGQDIESPVSDIVDSYYICKLFHQKQNIQ